MQSAAAMHSRRAARRAPAAHRPQQQRQAAPLPWRPRGQTPTPRRAAPAAGPHVCRAGFGGFGKPKGGAKAAAPPAQQQAAAGQVTDDKACPCGSGAAYKECCQRLHKGKLRPAAVTPEMVLRARYSAMALGYAFYLKDSSHPDNPALKGSDTDPATGVTKHCTYEEDMAVTLRSIKLTGLEILGPAAVDEPSGSATLDYAFSYKRRIDGRGAKIKDAQPAARAAQRAAFRRNEGRRWLLLDSVDLPAANAAAGGEVGAR
ncbi:MAG: hypothetical protein J3K34DRAFT_459747 [Monoraphidium minutum]|nr:MAG: hypothetical protein J3K34DRAFT_459747 [Monoraphidium minutum]